MAGPKSSQTRTVGITDKVHPYISFKKHCYFKINIGCTLSVIPTTLVCVLFGPAVPSLLFYATFYTCSITEVAIESRRNPKYYCILLYVKLNLTFLCVWCYKLLLIATACC